MRGALATSLSEVAAGSNKFWFLNFCKLACCFSMNVAKDGVCNAGLWNGMVVVDSSVRGAGVTSVAVGPKRFWKLACCFSMNVANVGVCSAGLWIGTVVVVAAVDGWVIVLRNCF